MQIEGLTAQLTILSAMDLVFVLLLDGYPIVP